MNRKGLNKDAEFSFLCMRKKDLPYNVLMKKMRTNPTAKLSYQVVEAIPCTNEKCLFPHFPYSVSTRDRKAIDNLVTIHKEFDTKETVKEIMTSIRESTKTGILMAEAIGESIDEATRSVLDNIPVPKELIK